MSPLHAFHVFRSIWRDCRRRRVILQAYACGAQNLLHSSLLLMLVNEDGPRRTQLMEAFRRGFPSGVIKDFKFDGFNFQGVHIK